LGNFLITDLKPARPGEIARITVQFDLDVNGILKVTARDRETGKQEAITVEASHARMSEAEILASRAWVDLGATDQAAFVLPNESAVVVRHAHDLLDGDTLQTEARQELETLLEGIESAQAKDQSQELKDLLESLEDLLFDLEVE
jgi:molecular chaperone DnaK